MNKTDCQTIPTPDTWLGIPALFLEKNMLTINAFVANSTDTSNGTVPNTNAFTIGKLADINLIIVSLIQYQSEDNSTIPSKWCKSIHQPWETDEFVIRVSEQNAWIGQYRHSQPYNQITTQPQQRNWRVWQNPTIVLDNNYKELIYYKSLFNLKPNYPKYLWLCEPSCNSSIL